MRDNGSVTPRAPIVRTVAGAAALLVTLTMCGSNGRPNGSGLPDCPEPKGIVSIGERIPTDCKFELLGGGTFSLASLAGKPALINFWAAWCTFCIDEMPAFQKVYASVKGRVAFVGANLLGVQGETRTVAKAFAKRTGVKYTLIYDEGAVLLGHFSAGAYLPVTVFVKANGVVADRKFGPFDEHNLREALRTHFGIRTT